MTRDPLFWIGLALGVGSLVTLLALSWKWGSSRPKDATEKNWLVDAAEHKRRVEENRQIAMGRVREIEQRRAS